MPAINKTHLADVAAKISVSPFASGIPTLTPGTNDDTVHAYIGANFTFERVASVIDLQIAESVSDNLVQVDADECDTGTILKKTQPAITTTSTWYESANPNAREIILGLTSLNVAGTPVTGATQLFSNPSAYDTFFKIENQNGDGSPIVATDLTGSIDGSYGAPGTDYKIVDNGEGEYGIQLISGGSITTLTQDFTLTYNYTPNASIYQSIVAEQQDVPSVVVKIETCPDENGKINTYYIVDASLNGELLTPFIDVTRAGDLTGSTLEFTTNKSGYLVAKLDRQA